MIEASEVERCELLRCRTRARCQLRLALEQPADGGEVHVGDAVLDQCLRGQPHSQAYEGVAKTPRINATPDGSEVFAAAIDRVVAPTAPSDCFHHSGSHTMSAMLRAPIRLPT